LINDLHQGVDQVIDQLRTYDCVARSGQRIYGQEIEAWAKQCVLFRKSVGAKENETEVLVDRSGKDLFVPAPKLLRRHFP
jgi:hypothetical protein